MISANLISKFNKGDTVYYVPTNGKGLVKNDTPYKVVECRPKSESYYGLSVRLPDGRTPYFPVDDFISEEDYKSSKIKDWVDKGIATKEETGKHNFKNGEIAYYNGSDDQFDHHTPFRLWDNKNTEVFDIWANGIWGQILVDFVNREFITEEEYKRKYGNQKPKKDKENTRLGSYNTFVNKKFKAGDVVYYIGDKIKRLKQDTPYKIEFYNPLTGLMKIEGDVCPDSDFISQDQYERLKMLNDEDKGDGIGEERKALDETSLKMKVYKDTKSGKLQWYRPFPIQDEWFRTKINLEKPKGAYIRIDIKRPADDWEMHVYYHRNKFSEPPLFASDNSIEIRKYDESSQILKVIVKKIEDKLGEPDDIKYQSYD
jgi:hypothetical protein